MCEVGRIKHHLKHNLWRKDSTILFVGYQAVGTLGRKIVDGAKNVKIFGEEITVNADVRYIEGFSGHADKNGLLNFIETFSVKPKQVYLVHGDEDAQYELAEEIGNRFGIPVEIPMRGDIYDVDVDRIKKTGELRSPNENKYIRLEVLEKMETLREELAEMTMIVGEDLKEETTNAKVKDVMEKLKALEMQIVEILK